MDYVDHNPFTHNLAHQAWSTPQGLDESYTDEEERPHVVVRNEQGWKPFHGESAEFVCSNYKPTGPCHTNIYVGQVDFDHLMQLHASYASDGYSTDSIVSSSPSIQVHTLQVSTSKALGTLSMRDGVLTGNEITNSRMPYIKVQLGARENEGPMVNSIKDSGCTAACMEAQLWPLIKDNHLIRTRMSNNTLTVANSVKLKIEKEALLTITLHSIDGRYFSFQHWVNIVPNLQYHFYCGNDILAGKNFLIETPGTLYMTSNPSLVKQIIVPPHKDVFPIPNLQPTTPHFGHINIFRANGTRVQSE